jgi:hypothetical protein
MRRLTARPHVLPSPFLRGGAGGGALRRAMTPSAATGPALSGLGGHADPDRAGNSGPAQAAIAARIFRQVLLVITLGEFPS